MIMTKYNRIGNIIGLVIIILVITLLCCCIDFNSQGIIMNRDNITVFDNTTNLYNTITLDNNGEGNITLYNNTTISDNTTTLYNNTTFDNNGTSNITLYNRSNSENSKLNNINNENNSHKNKTYIKYPKIINYTILKYGKYSKEDREYYYSYIDKLRNKTIVFIYGGKRPVDYSINIDKIIRNSNNDVSIYVERVLSSPLNTSDFIITSPYIVLEINGTIENINIEYI